MLRQAASSGPGARGPVSGASASWPRRGFLLLFPPCCLPGPGGHNGVGGAAAHHLGGPERAPHHPGRSLALSPTSTPRPGTAPSGGRRVRGWPAGTQAGGAVHLWPPASLPGSTLANCSPPSPSISKETSSLPSYLRASLSSWRGCLRPRHLPVAEPNGPFPVCFLLVQSLGWVSRHRARSTALPGDPSPQEHQGRAWARDTQTPGLCVKVGELMYHRPRPPLGCLGSTWGDHLAHLGGSKVWVQRPDPCPFLQLWGCVCWRGELPPEVLTPGCLGPAGAAGSWHG